MSADTSAPTASDIASFQALRLDAASLGPLDASSLPSSVDVSTARGVGALIDHTLLAPGATDAQLAAVCAEAVQYGAASVCVNSSRVGFVAQTLLQLEASASASAGTKHTVMPIAVVGFPFGAGNTQGKVAETKQAIADGAKEIDMVQNIGLLKSGHYAAVYADISAVVSAAGSVPVKVILETAQLTRAELALASYLAVRAGAAFLKTCTGYGGGGAAAADVRLMAEVARRFGGGGGGGGAGEGEHGGRKVQVKASGGVRTLDALREMVQNGATRIGASGTKAIVAQAQGGAEASEAASAAPGGY